MLLPFIFKSVFRRLRRYRFLVMMIGFGIAAVTIVQSVTEGMAANVIEGSARYLGGRYMVIARKGPSTRNLVERPEEVLSALKDAGIEPRLVVKREIASDNSPTLFFNGESFEMRRITGADFKNESSVFSKISFTSGGYSAMPGSSGILISSQVAKRFGARVGDEITLRMYNLAGFLDSATLTIQGIFNDASIFGYYNCYVDFELLRKLLGDPEGVCMAMGFYFDGNEDTARTRTAIAAALASRYPPFDKLESKNDSDIARILTWEGTRFGILPVEKYIDSKVMDLIRAIQAVSYLFLVLMLAMILIGMRNTTQIMTAKRTKELGTIRAIGLSRPRTRRMVTAESLLIASIGFVIGFVCALFVLLILQAFPFEWSAGFDIFLKRGHLTWSLSAPFLIIDYAALCLMTLAGSFPAARRAAAVEPAAAMTLHE